MKRFAVAALLVLGACGQSAQQDTPPPAPASSSADSGTWDRNLMALMPQIDACIADANGARYVSYAGEHNGAVLVRLRGETPVDCRVASTNGAASTDVRPRDETLSIDGEDAAIFVRGPGENPGGQCYEAPEVRDANGALLGWMLDPEGC